VEEGQCGGHPPLLREVREARKHKIINKYKNNLFSIQYRQLLSYINNIYSLGRDS
jgi:hypothetical protein